MGFFFMGFFILLILVLILGMYMVEYYGYDILWLFVGGISIVVIVGLVVLEKQMKSYYQFVQ